jgi:hypothetical protein
MSLSRQTKAVNVPDLLQYAYIFILFYHFQERRYIIVLQNMLCLFLISTLIKVVPESMHTLKDP